MLTGGCYCGAIAFEITGPMTGVTYCHCSKCRKWHGHYGAYTAVDREFFKLTNEKGLKWHAVSPTVKRGFCMECGSSVLFDEAAGEKISICAGTLDSPTSTREKAHIYVGSKGDYYDIADNLLQYETFPGK